MPGRELGNLLAATTDREPPHPKTKKAPRRKPWGFFIYMAHLAGFEPTTPAFGVLKVGVWNQYVSGD